MSGGLFAAALLAGAATLAFWLDARFPRLAAVEVRPLLLHAGAAMLALALLPTEAETVRAAFLAVFAGALPALVYAFLVGVWALKLAQRTLGGQLR